MCDAQIIAPIRYFDWVYNLVPTRKKTGEIRLCADFRNLNKVSLKGNYPLPKMDHILQRLVGSSRISLLDGFSGYNQILVQPKDHNFYYSLGHFYVCKNAFFFNECRGYLS